MTSNTICTMAWNHQFVDGTGRVKPCCRFDGNNGPIGNTLDDNFSSTNQAALRRLQLKGQWHKGCIRCHEEESAGKTSLRERYTTDPVLNNIDLINPSIQWVELALSNDCNLACRMCDSRYSHKLYNEEIEIYGSAKSKTHRTKIDIERILPHIKDLRHIKFTGGEPLVMQDQWRILDHAIEIGAAKNIYLNYSTNATVYPTVKMVDRWREFESIEIMLSIDSIVRSEIEYLRWPTNYDTMLKVTGRFLELRKELNLTVAARPTVTSMNVYHLPETLDWLTEHDIAHNTTHLTYPDTMSVTVLPQQLKQRINDKFKNYKYKHTTTRAACDYILNYMNSADNSNRWSEFLEFTTKMDHMRNQDFFDVYDYYHYHSS